ncbi:hypothetical protein FCZ47_19310 [Escherichia coli]|nr:hypothetical protein [Escherichia coli]
MKLHHRMLRHFIAASVIVLTSSFLIFELVASDRAMSAYLRYIVQKADSSFLYDKYQNQSIAAHVMRALAAEQSEVSPEQRRAICEAFESAWICPYISRHLLSLNPLLACCRRYSRGER